MQCTSCDAKAVFETPTLCKEHFMQFVENTVKDTIQEHKLCTKEDKICVAASGGKDSAAVLVIFKKLGFSIEALAVDEGIAGYRDKSLDDLKKLCTDYDIPLRVVSFEEEVGKPLDVLAKDQYPCSVCGVFRRYILNKYAKGYSLIATGHNLDDEAQSVLMNITKANHAMFYRSHVRTPAADGFVPRIKPLFFLTEKIIMAYTVLLGLQIRYGECPHVPLAMRAKVRDVLNEYERNNPGMKLQLVEAALHIATQHKPVSLEHCQTCGEPSAHAVCRACMLKKELVGDVS